MTTINTSHFFVTINVGNSNITLSRSDIKKTVSAHNKNMDLAETFMTWTKKKSFYLLFCSVLKDEDFSRKYPLLFNLIKNFSAHHPERILNFMSHRDEHSFLKMPVDYSKTLGQDRLVQSYFLWTQIKNSTCSTAMIVDAGTMLTADIVDKDRGLLGGYIFPGLERYAKSFNVSSRLPETDSIATSLMANFASTKSTELPHHTLDALSYGYKEALGNFFQHLWGIYRIQKVIFTGGHGYLWHSIFTQNSKMPPLVFELNPDYSHESLWQIGSEMVR